MKKMVLGFMAMIMSLCFAGSAMAYSIRDDATGGDCTQIGAWDWVNKTCTLTRDLFEGISILSDGIVLDGNNHTLTGPENYMATGIYLNGRTGVTVKKIIAHHFNEGLRLDGANGNIFADNIVQGNGRGIYLCSSSSNSFTNSVSSNNSTGVYLIGYPFGCYAASSSYNTFSGNVLSNNGANITLVYSSTNNSFIKNDLTGANQAVNIMKQSDSNEFRGNVISAYGGYGVYIWESGYNILANNTIKNSPYGVVCYNTAYNDISNNNFIDNGVQIIGGGPDTYSKPAPVGGNYFCDFDGTEEGCNDLNSDGFCDVPYYFSGGADYLPWTTRDGWLTPAELIQDLTTQIQEMLNSGEITGVATATSLTQVLESALNAQDAGNERASDNILTGFIKQVEGQARAGRIAEDDARQLIDAAAEIINK